MKICVYNVTSTIALPGTREVGGTEEFSFRIAEAWQRMGHEVELVGGRPREGARSRTTTVPVKLFPYRETREFPDLGSRFRKLMQRVHFGWRALRYLREQGFDLLLAFKPYDLVPLSLAGLGEKTTVLLRFGGTDFFLTDCWWSGAADALFANSAETARLVADRFGRPCEVVSNGVQVPEREAAIGPDSRTILSAGRLVGWKGYAVLLEALSPLRNRKNWKLVLMGEGDERPRLESLIEEFGLGGKVEMRGVASAEEVQRALLKGGLYVQPSIGFDSCPNAVMEAMAAGLPVVISSRVGLVEGFEPGRHGLVVPAGDHQLLAEALIKFVDDPAAHAPLGRDARQLIAERHTVEGVAHRILELAKR
jgi:glycosyltransferase involved in cell wall biosynthesis